MKNTIILAVVLALCCGLAAQTHTYPALDTTNNFLGTNTFPIVSGFYFVDGTVYTTPQQAVTASCAATPAGGTVFIGPGSFSIPLTMCSGITLVGAGKDQADSTTCPTTLTYSGTTTALSIASMNHIYIGNMCIKYTGVGTSAIAIILG